MTDRFQKLQETASDTDKAELVLAHNCRIEAMKAYRDRPGKSTKDDYDAARGFLEETIDRLWRRYFPEEAPAPEGERFKNRVQALNWLQAQGYKISQGKFYTDCKAGFPAIHKDGTVSRYQVLQYGQQLDIERRAIAPVDAAASREADENRKVKADADKAEMQAEDMRREQDKKWLHQDQAWETLAAILGSLRDALRHQFHAGQMHLIHLAGGDSARGPEVYEGCEELIARGFNEVLHAGNIEGVFEAEGEEDI